MKKPPKHSAARAVRPVSVWPTVLALLSAAGLIALGLIGGWRALRDAEDAAAVEGRRAAAGTAQAVRDRIGHPRLTELFLPHLALTLTADKVEAKSGSPKKRGGFVQSIALQRVLKDSARTEFGEGGPEAAKQQLLRALARGVGRDAFGELSLEIAIAWVETRSGKLDKQRIDKIAKATPGSADQAASQIILLSRHGRPIPRELAEWLGLLREVDARAVVARAVRNGDDVQKRYLEGIVDRASHQRHAIRIARRRHDELLNLKTPTLVFDHKSAYVILVRSNKEQSSERLLYFRELIGFSNALRDASQVASSPLGRIEWAGSVRRGDRASPGAIPLIHGLVLEPEIRSPDGLGGRPLAVGLLLLALALLLAVSLAVTLRGLRRTHESLALQREFLGGVSHELRTPLASIRMFAELLESGRVRDDVKRSEYHRLLAAESTRLSTLVENVLDLGRIERGERSYERRPIAFDELVREALELFEPLADRHGLVVERRGPGLQSKISGSVVEGDRGALMQSLWNLFENASKYGGGHLEVELRSDENAVAIKMRDRGPGVPRGERERIFERFRRGEDQAHGAIPGIGLGLYLARTIVRAHGGQLEYVEPDEGPGACFVLSLPTVQGAAA